MASTLLLIQIDKLLARDDSTHSSAYITQRLIFEAVIDRLDVADVDDTRRPTIESRQRQLVC